MCRPRWVVAEVATAPLRTGTTASTRCGSSLLWADVWATAAFARGAGATSWLAGLRGFTGLVVHPDGTTSTTRG
jgi:thiamine biosynthesis lipoprotein